MSIGKDHNSTKSTVTTTVIIVSLALIAITAATLAWFSIADQTRLSSMRLDITTAKSLRFDLDEHEVFDDYVATLGFDQIAERIRKNTGIDISTSSLEPVTTEDGEHFFYQNGEPAESKDVIEFQLNFMATTDMFVHLTSENSEKGTDGTAVSSENPETPLSMRIAFLTEDGCYVYDPGLNGTRKKINEMYVFGLLASDRMEYNESNMLFIAPENKNVPVTVRIWVEGTDETCNNDIKNSDYSIRLRFEGTDVSGQRIN